MVDAADGSYRVVSPPGYDHPSITNGQALALSPSGNSLAYFFFEDAAEEDEATERAFGGIRILDLSSGSIRDVEVRTDATRGFVGLIWSADGSHLSWSIAQAPQFAHGVIGQNDTVSIETEFARNPQANAVTNEGQLVLVRDSRRLEFPDSNTPPVKTRVDGSTESAAAIDVTGTLIATGIDPTYGPDRSDPSVSGSIVRLDDGTRQKLYTDARGEVASRPLGWVGDSPLMFVRGIDNSGDALTEPTLELAGPDGSRVVSRAAGWTSDLSIATDLMTAGQPTVTRPEPYFGPSPRLKIGLGAGLLSLAYAGFLLRGRRRRAAARLDSP